MSGPEGFGGEDPAADGPEDRPGGIGEPELLGVDPEGGLLSLLLPPGTAIDDAERQEIAEALLAELEDPGTS